MRCWNEMKCNSHCLGLRSSSQCRPAGRLLVLSQQWLQAEPWNPQTSHISPRLTFLTSPGGLRFYWEKYKYWAQSGLSFSDTGGSEVLSAAVPTSRALCNAGSLQDCISTGETRQLRCLSVSVSTPAWLGVHSPLRTGWREQGWKWPIITQVKPGEMSNRNIHSFHSDKVKNAHDVFGIDFSSFLVLNTLRSSRVSFEYFIL